MSIMSSSEKSVLALWVCYRSLRMGRVRAQPSERDLLGNNTRDSRRNPYYDCCYTSSWARSKCDSSNGWKVNRGRECISSLSGVITVYFRVQWAPEACDLMIFHVHDRRCFHWLFVCLTWTHSFAERTALDLMKSR